MKAGSEWPFFRLGVFLRSRLTWLVQLTRMGSLAGILDNSQSLLGIVAGFGLARHFRVPVRTRI